jgi:spermidine/putrescine transport system substrate-binding protein
MAKLTRYESLKTGIAHERPDRELRMKRQAPRIGRRELLQRAGAFGLMVGTLGAVRAEASSPPDIRGQTIRFVNYTAWIGKGEYDKFKAQTGAEVREIPLNEGRSQRVVADPTSADMILDPLGPLGMIDAAGLLATLTLANIPNYALIHDSFKQGLASPPQSKAVPIDWGRTGILYRTDLVSEQVSKWADFWSAASKHSGKVVIPDSPNHVIRNALLMLGLNGNSHDEAEVKRAADAIIRLKRDVGAFASPDAVKRLLEGSAVLVMAEDWQGSSALRENPKVALKWVDPAEGAAGYLDCIGAINKTEVQPAIEQFLNFHLDPQVAANFCNTLSTAPIEPASGKYLDDSIKKDAVTNPPADVLNRVVYWSYLGEAQRYWDDAWTRVKSA